MTGSVSRYATDAERLHWFQRFDLTPTPPSLINEELRNGAVLETMDVPGFLGTPAQIDCETGVGLYRLVQLWGTPNVPGRTAGAMEIDRELTTWQYLFDVEYEREEDDDPAVPASFRLSVYDYRTGISVGLAGFGEPDEGGWAIQEPRESAVPSVPRPPEPFLEGVVALGINMVDEAVPATFKELWV